jgi:perosamine synthetase
MIKREVPFSGVGYKYEEDDYAVVIEAMKSESTYTQGKYQDEFERKFSAYTGSPYSFATSSAATAIELVAQLFGIKEGDEVVAPAHTYAASVYPFAKRGAKIRWADIDPKEFIVTLDSIKKVVTPKTKAIIIVNLYGLPVDAKEIMDFARERNILVMEDCAQSIGSRINGSIAGKFADACVYSFQSHKNISTLGEGGMLTVTRETWANLIPGLRHNGHRPFEIDPDKYWSPAMSDVTFDLDGVWPNNFCLGEIQCALGSHLINKVEAINSKRRDRFLMAQQATKDFLEIQWQEIPDNKISAHHLLPFKFISPLYKEGADQIFERLSVKYGVRPAKQYYPLYRYSLFSKSGNGIADVPCTDDFYDNMVSLPFHHWMSDDDFSYVLESLISVIVELRKG